MSSSDSVKEDENIINKFRFDLLLGKYRLPLTFLLLGLILVGTGLFLAKQGLIERESKIEIIDSDETSKGLNSQVVVEISGAVEKPGVYKLDLGTRVEDLLIAAGGISADADREWVEKYINRAAKLVDGQKLHILQKNEQTLGDKSKSFDTQKAYQDPAGVTRIVLVNINTSNQRELEDLPGIGPVYAQNIIEQRPYSSVEELLSREVLKKHVYEKIKDKITVY